ncbi:SDR family NAD(P)-dependent oxidoreductase [Chitinophaga nivalis]|uniref:SDR family oxidoreductase n=1 Tax=Chitinophaga nivalis TaxID=2991709 RepID=A0ABT3ITM3_9BACT|nr:SDR family oxidoreductase [Chitinophaga nivalis]MCW3462990.1 SDR family oxidoreductase [Chitinophaga nivalis]MCW3487320.1 SDR family oxidoreductase [Chitinophaga nivalis]
MDLYLKGKTAVITGGSQGLGRAIAKELAIQGVKVFVNGRNETLLESFKEEVAAAGGIAPITFAQDFVAPDGPQKIAAAALESLGHVDILINNAGRSRQLDIIAPDEEWAASMTLDFERHRQLTQLLLPQFIARKQGAILNIASSYELRVINASAVAKAAVIAWSKGLAAQLAQYGITVNSLQPGIIDTEQIRRIFPGEERRKFAEREIPMGDFGEPQDIANMATFLVSPRAKYITGTVAVVDGGMRRYPF